MTASQASVPTAHAAKYIQQLCKHWGHKLEVTLSDDGGVVHFPTSKAMMHARPGALDVRIEAPDDATLERMQGVVAAHLDRFAFREAPLPFEWSRAVTPAGGS